jgi:hypothetical protein
LVIVTWSPSINFLLGVLFVALGLAAAGLQFWLWRFPMAPDPTGRDPNGVTTAPRFWRYTHRFLGYVFVVIYGLLASQMIPRLWTYSEWSATSVAHAVVGAAILPLLFVKVGILRLWQRHGKKLLLVGTMVLACSIVAVGLVAPATLKASSGPEPGRSLVAERCHSCHGASTVVSEDGDFRDWIKVLEEMRENAEEMRRPDPVRGDARVLAEYLSRVRGDD